MNCIVRADNIYYYCREDESGTSSLNMELVKIGR